MDVDKRAGAFSCKAEEEEWLGSCLVNIVAGAGGVEIMVGSG